MRILFLNQTFYPDKVATAQYLAEMAVSLVGRKHDVYVISGRRAYDDQNRRFVGAEVWNGVRIFRVDSTGFGKSVRWRRATDFASFILGCHWRLLMVKCPDVVVAMTSPPLISFIGANYAKMRRCRFVYWVMDLNPDEAVAAGWLRADTVMGRTLEEMSRFSLRHAARVVALDRFMRQRILAKGIRSECITVIPPWSHDSDVRFDAAGRERFRVGHGLQDKLVVMYSGNHSPVHPLDTLLRAAELLKDDPRIHFCFIGGGSEFKRVQCWAAEGSRSNVLCMQYQPLGLLAASLSAADTHVVVMGDAMLGLVHPCKIYNILAVGAPVLYIGPTPSHVSEILDELGSDYPSACVAHGDVACLVQVLRELASNGRERRPVPPRAILEKFSQKKLMTELTDLIEEVGRMGKAEGKDEL